MPKEEEEADMYFSPFASFRPRNLLVSVKKGNESNELEVDERMMTEYEIGK